MLVDQLSEHVIADMKAKDIDVEETIAVLDNYNSGKYDNVMPLKAIDIPSIDGKRVIDLVRNDSFTIDRTTAYRQLDSLGIRLPGDLPPGSIVERGESLFLTREALSRIGVLLYPVTAYGILNGGSATSYVDRKKNQNFNKGLFNLFRNEFEVFSPLYTDKPKGISPAFVNPNGSPGESFLLLKFRALLIQVLEYQAATGVTGNSPLSVFQMTSAKTNDDIAAAYTYFADHPLIRDLIRETGRPIMKIDTGIQHMLAALTHSAEGKPKGVFTEAFGKQDSTLPLPAGHGRNFTVLRKIYEKLRLEGKRYAYISNVDNLGSTVDPVELALLALTGKQAAFDFAFRTPVDVKGGILVTDQYGRMNCADIGPAISLTDVRKIEKYGTPILFNCATGLFDLEYLIANLDRIIDNLPMRFSDQDKDAGRYSQAEQVTWEVIGMLDDFLIFAIDKYDRFLAAKLFIENLLTSGIKSGMPGNPLEGPAAAPLRDVASSLRKGLAKKLRNEYGMKLVDGRWIPQSVEELRKR
jgi:UTP--glucose-1-phosphate uridylyltransferase